METQVVQMLSWEVSNSRKFERQKLRAPRRLVFRLEKLSGQQTSQKVRIRTEHFNVENYNSFLFKAFLFEEYMRDECDKLLFFCLQR